MIRYVFGIDVLVVAFHLHSLTLLIAFMWCAETSVACKVYRQHAGCHLSTTLPYLSGPQTAHKYVHLGNAPYEGYLSLDI